jgi:plasmid maintenance system antidote protein VapI
VGLSGFENAIHVRPHAFADGNTPEFWLNAQRAVDLWEAARAHKADLDRIDPATAA